MNIQRFPIGAKVKVRDGAAIGAKGQFPVKPDGKVATVVGYDEAQGHPNTCLLDTPICGFKLWDSSHLISA
jgi:hypothetical protein